MLLELNNVVAGYGGSDVLKGVDLGIEQGSVTCIVGPNGAGKSTCSTVDQRFAITTSGPDRLRGAQHCRDVSTARSGVGHRAGAAEP